MSKELLFSITKKDFDIDYFSGTGAGGQYRNRHPNCVRLTHRESGARTTGQSNRERPANLREAFSSMRENPTFKLWYNRKVMELLENETIEEKVEKMMIPSNLVIEEKVDGKWVKVIDNIE